MTQNTCNLMPQLEFMNNKCIEIDGYRILGTGISVKFLRHFAGATLWGKVKEEERDIVEYAYNDYRCIHVEKEKANILDKFVPKDEDVPTDTKDNKYVVASNVPKRLLRVNDTLQWHKDTVKWIEQEIAVAKQKNQLVIILTHYCPLEFTCCTCSEDFGTGMKFICCGE